MGRGGANGRKGENISFEAARPRRNCYFACGANRIPKRAPREMLLRENVQPSFMHSSFFRARPSCLSPPCSHYLPRRKSFCSRTENAGVSRREEKIWQNAFRSRFGGVKCCEGYSPRREGVDRYDFYGIALDSFPIFARERG